MLFTAAVNTPSPYLNVVSFPIIHLNRRRSPQIVTAATKSLASVAVTAAVIVSIFTAAPSTAAELDGETLANVPQTLSGECAAAADCKKPRIQRPKSRKAETCTVKCLNTCIRGEAGEGPLNIRRPLVVFKEGFRSRQYCLVECSEICNLIGDGDDGP